MIAEKFWSKDRFPVVYENDKPKAFMVDVDSFEKIGMILDNLMNREAESEDEILVQSGILQKMLAEVEKSEAVKDWRAELDAI